ncbi:MAG: hypothetical protein FWD19_01345 [Defluviitaleaceae bacterium]|nr:hypothetical protein [Defluviitaleaceae bacterium]
MEKKDYRFEDFFEDVNDKDKDFVSKVHELLTRDDCKIKVELKATGFFASYSHPTTKRSILNFAFRKKGLMVRIYGDNCNKYEDVLNRLPEKMVKQIEKAGVCKRILDPKTCNPKCVMGYDFKIGKNKFQKCRNSCFFFEVDAESVSFLLELIESEKNSR